MKGLKIKGGVLVAAFTAALTTTLTGGLISHYHDTQRRKTISAVFEETVPRGSVGYDYKQEIVKSLAASDRYSYCVYVPLAASETCDKVKNELRTRGIISPINLLPINWKPY